MSPQQTKEQARQQAKQQQSQAMQQGMRTQLLYFLVMILLLFVYTIPVLRNAFALPMTYILQPVIGFNYHWPLFTILAASVLTAFVNTVARHFFMDYFAMAEMQHNNRKLSARYREAIRKRDKDEMDAVRAQQSASMQDSMKITQQQMKPTFVTLILSVLIFAWMIGFMIDAHSKGFTTVYTPFGTGDLMNVFHGFYYWIAFYSIFSIMISYPLQYILKLSYLRRSVSG